MRIRRSIAAILTLLGVLGASAVSAQREEGTGSRPERLDPDAFALRVLLGVGDPQVQPWNGRVKLDKGEVLGVEGYRFRKGDRVAGRDSWEAKSHTIRKTAKKGAVPPKVVKGKTTGPSTVGAAVTPNGVVVTLKAPADATLTVETPRGNFDVRLSDLAGGAPRRYLDGKAEAQRIEPGVPLLDGDAQEDFPAAAADARGNAWVAYVVHTPRGPRCSNRSPSGPRPSRARARRGRRPDPAAPVRRRQARRTDRRDRRRARRVAALGRRGRRWLGRRRLGRVPRRRLRPLPPQVRPREEEVVRPEAADDEQGDRHRRRPGDRARRHRLDGLAGLARRPGRHPGGPRRAPRAGGPRERDPGQRMVAGAGDRPGAGASTWPTTRTRRATTTSCSAPGGPTAPGGHRSSWPDRPGSRRGRPWPPTRAGGSGSPTRSATRTGARTPRTSSRARARPSTARPPCGSAASTAAACSTRPTRWRTPRRTSGRGTAIPGWRSTARAGSGWRSGIARRRSGATTP